MEPALSLGFALMLAGPLYAYLGYPIFLALVSRSRDSDVPDSALGTLGMLPGVSIVIAAFDEEACIAEKLRNCLEQDYPPELMEILVVSDGSTDRTADIVRDHSDERVRLLKKETRGGKNLALNDGAKAARGDILVFTDANAFMAPGSLGRLMAPFRDSQVGLVSGQGLYRSSEEASAAEVSNGYARFESFIKQREAALGFVAAADGALYAMRRNLYQPLASNQVHDLLHPIQVSLAGKLSRFVPEAVTLEVASQNPGQEFRRHVRIIAQGFLVMLSEGGVMLRRGKLRELWMLASHRLLRWLSFFFLLGALLCNLLLLGRHPIFAATGLLQALFYLLALGGALADRFGIRARLLAVPLYFCIVSLAGLSGFWRFLRGQHFAVWSQTGERRMSEN